ncbi:MAG: sigma-54-dependent Fis family transcriptional regulator [Methylocella sp.]
MTTRKVDVRAIAATNRDRAREVRERRFREDLYYRLNVFPIRVPALRERPDDIVPLAAYFVAKYSRKIGRPLPGIAPKVLGVLRSYRWPGNVRELEHVIERGHILAALESTGWKVSGPNGAAGLLGLKATTLEARMRKLGIFRIAKYLGYMHVRQPLSYDKYFYNRLYSFIF